MSKAAVTPAQVQAQVSELVSRLVREDIRAMSAYPVPSSAGMVKLDAMENPYSLPEPLRAAIGAAVATLGAALMSLVSMSTFTALQLRHHRGLPRCPLHDFQPLRDPRRCHARRA